MPSIDTSDMIDLGRTYEDGPCCSPATEKGKEKKKSYPSVYISGGELPELPDGDFYALVKVCKARISIDTRDDKNSSMELDIKSIKPVGEAPKGEDDEEYAAMKDLEERGAAGGLSDALDAAEEED